MATKTQKGPNKTSFVRDFIQKSPEANRKAIEEAWQEAGHEGSISSSLVSNLRSESRLTGNLGSGSQTPEGNGAPGSLKAKARRSKPKKRGRSSDGKASGIVAAPTEDRKPQSIGR